MKTSLDKLLDDSKKVPEQQQEQKEKEQKQEQKQKEKEKVVEKTERQKDMKKYGETSSQNKYAATVVNFFEMLKSNPDKVLHFVAKKLGHFVNVETNNVLSPTG